MLLYTIGFTKKSAQRFFALLEGAEVQRLIDIRLNPSGQLSGFAKQDDLAFFLDRLAGIDYRHVPELAPTDAILTEYRADKDWAAYERRFAALMDERQIPDTLDRELFDPGPVCLLCSEDGPERCHRRLVAERIAASWGDVDIRHLR
jgi:uncharacterized protein (DUF488 family)